MELMKFTVRLVVRAATLVEHLDHPCQMAYAVDNFRS